MSRTIKLFEAFAGIGSQYKALLNISERKKWNIKVVGIIEWFIPAICAYVELYSKQNLLCVNRERERRRFSFHYHLIQKNHFLEIQKLK